MTAVLARIIARYVSGGLLAYGLIGSDMAEQMAMDPDVALAIGAVLGAASEAAYAVAVKRGWAK